MRPRCSMHEIHNPGETSILSVLFVSITAPAENNTKNKWQVKLKLMRDSVKMEWKASGDREGYCQESKGLNLLASSHPTDLEDCSALEHGSSSQPWFHSPSMLPQFPQRSFWFYTSGPSHSLAPVASDSIAVISHSFFLRLSEKFVHGDQRWRGKSCNSCILVSQHPLWLVFSDFSASPSPHSSWSTLFIFVINLHNLRSNSILTACFSKGNSWSVDPLRERHAHTCCSLFVCLCVGVDWLIYAFVHSYCMNERGVSLVWIHFLVTRVSLGTYENF